MCSEDHQRFPMRTKKSSINNWTPRLYYLKKCFVSQVLIGDKITQLKENYCVEVSKTFALFVKLNSKIRNVCKKRFLTHYSALLKL